MLQRRDGCGPQPNVNQKMAVVVRTQSEGDFDNALALLQLGAELGLVYSQVMDRCVYPSDISDGQ